MDCQGRARQRAGWTRLASIYLPELGNSQVRMPSTPSLYARQGVDARDKRGHDDVVFTVHAIPH
jgi:hypothetical protein